jgi:hypothetical protein
LDLVYDSSIYPVHHDRYGVPSAPCEPFLVRGGHHEILELPPATLRIGGVKLPVGGGGYFRLLPSPLLNLALTWSRRDPQTRVTMLYFHPWDFDSGQPRLPLKGLQRFRTYVGLRHSQRRLESLLGQYPFTRAIDLARALHQGRDSLPRYNLSPAVRVKEPQSDRLYLGPGSVDAI